jgi:lysophospholipase L1-like esterase
LPRPVCACHDRLVVPRSCWLAFLLVALSCSNVPAAPVKGPPTDEAFAPVVDRSDAASGRSTPEPRLASALPSETGEEAEVAASALPTRPVSRFGHLEAAERLSHVFEALAGLEDGRSHDDVHILQYGDSHTASDVESGALRRQLQTRFGDGGRGFVSVGKPWKTYVQDGIRGSMTKEFEPRRTGFEDGRPTGDGCYGLLGVAIGSDRPGARAWTQVTLPTSRVEIDYWQQPRGGTFDVFIDGSHAGRIATRSQEAGGGFSAFEVPEAPHEIELRTVGDGDVRVFGMDLDRARAGVLVDALGINGAQVFTALRWSEDHFAKQLSRRSPDLVVLAYGTNESLDAKLELGDYERALVDLLGRISRAAPRSSCLLLGPPDLARRSAVARDGWTTWPRLLDIVAAQRRVAGAAGCAFYDQLNAMGGPGSMAAWASEPEPRGGRDRVHLTRTGYTLLGTTFANDLIRAYDAWRVDRMGPHKTWGVAAR